MKVALFGGTFDPVHNGHINAAVEVLRQKIVDEAWLVPVCWHALKENSSVSAMGHRKKMIELAISGKENLKAIDLNANPTYALDTILKAKKRFPKNTYFWLMGTNLVEEFSSWKEPERILEETKIILFPVPGSEGKKSELLDPGNAIRVKAEPVNLSSTLVRKRLAEGKSVSSMLCPRVLAYIKKTNLYSGNK